MSASDQIPSRPGSSGHEVVDHTSEITLRIRALTYPELIREATRAFTALVPDRALGAVRDTWHRFTVHASDRASGLVEWLNELVYLSEAETWLPADLEIEAEGETRLHVRARERALEEPFVLVKAATLHGVHVREEPTGLVAEVTLDI